MCKVLKISKSSYYLWINNGHSKRWVENENLLMQITNIFEDSSKTYGSPRINAELEAKGILVSRPRVARIMKAAGIRARKPRRFIATTDSRHNYPVAPNILNREFTVTGPGQAWVSDLTYIKTSNGWLYLTVIIDLFERKVVGWAMSNGMSAEETIIVAWRMAIINRPIVQKLIFHSDRGIQFACTKFTTILNANKFVVRSMSRKGNCWDNAVAESFFKTIKVESVYNQTYHDQNQAKLSIFTWIETWYNRRRRHSALGYKTIEEFEILTNNKQIAA